MVINTELARSTKPRRSLAMAGEILRSVTTQKIKSDT
jgi:hypothetical protein